MGELEQLLVKRSEELAEPKELANLNLALAVWHLRKEKNAEALPYLKAAVELDDSSAISHAYLGAALAEEFEIEAARDELLKALELNSEDAIVHLKMAEFNLKIGLTLDAQKHLEAALQLPLPTLDTKIYVANLLQNTRLRNRRVIERKNLLPGASLVNNLRKAFKRNETKLES
jgi:Tfp pilus assembly protein PilF